MGRYDDLLGIEAPIALKHPRMSMDKRAAQFMPFAALTGYGASIDEATRLTDNKAELDENARELLDQKLRQIAEWMGSGEGKRDLTVSVRYFEPDSKKSGGTYRTLKGRMVKIDLLERTIVIQEENRVTLGVEDIYSIDCDLFHKEDGSYNEIQYIHTMKVPED